MKEKKQEMQNDGTKMYDVYISYRRSTGAMTAKILYLALKERGLRVFYDMEDLKSGYFNDMLSEEIKQSRNVIVLMTEGALERCVNNGDWVRTELELAISHGVNLVPVVPSGVRPYFPSDLPESLQEIAHIQCSELNLETQFESSVDRIVSRLKGFEDDAEDRLDMLGAETKDTRAFSSRKDIFISYSRNDINEVKAIKNELEDQGFSCWMDLEGIESGSREFTQDIIDAIDASTAFLFFLSTSSQESEWALKEIDYAKSERKHVVLVRFNADPMTKKFRFEFGRTDIIDWRDSLQKKKLLRDLKNWASQPQPFNTASEDDLFVKFRKKYNWLKEEQFPFVGEPNETGIYQNPDGGWQCNYGNWCAITLRPGQTELHEVHGAICARWYQEGGAFNERCERGWLGYPISDEEAYDGNGNSDDRISHFENGDIIWNSQTNECHVKPKSSGEHQGAETSCGPECVVEPCMVREEEAERKAWKGVNCKTIILPGGAKMEMIYCPPGEFMMGSPATEEGRGDDETQHRVRLTKGFWLGKYPVTQGQWQSVMGRNPSKFTGDDVLPVEWVSWNDCKRFIKKVKSSVKQQLGGDARFPTEAEWEYACRAGTTTAYFWGNALNGDRANCDGRKPCGTKTKGPYLKKTTPVGRYAPNPWGFHDMHGNVFEWCNDWAGCYPTGSVTDPIGPARGDRRVLRGGGWGSYARYCRSASCGGYFPGCCNGDFGFRLCCSAGPHR